VKNIAVTFLLALLVVLTCVSIRRMVGGTPTFAGQKVALVAIGPEPVPPLPPPPPKPNQ
jgi:hypothetical protein